jgi:hypothetical protein
MNRPSERTRIVRNLAWEVLQGPQGSAEARSRALEAAIAEEVTISEMLREALNLKAGVLESFDFAPDESDNDLVPVPCPS